MEPPEAGGPGLIGGAASCIEALQCSDGCGGEPCFEGCLSDAAAARARWEPKLRWRAHEGGGGDNGGHDSGGEGGGESVRRGGRRDASASDWRRRHADTCALHLR